LGGVEADIAAAQRVANQVARLLREDVGGVAVLRVVDVAEHDHRRARCLHLFAQQEAERGGLGGAANGGERGAQIGLVLLVGGGIGTKPGLAIDLGGIFRLEVADIDVDGRVVGAGADLKVQHRAREAGDGHADGGRLRVVTGALQHEFRRKGDDPFRLA